MVQNRPVYFEDLSEYLNKVMMNREIPRYFSFDSNITLYSYFIDKLTQVEIDYENKL